MCFRVCRFRFLIVRRVAILLFLSDSFTKGVQMAEYSLVRYWRYIFAPLVVIVVLFGWFILFNLSALQTSMGSLPPASAIPMPYSTAAATAAAAVAAGPLKT